MTTEPPEPKGVRIDEKFKKRLEKKEPPMRAAILECVKRLVDDPRHPGLRTESVQGVPGVFSSRVDRGNRLTWHWDGQVIVLRNHCNHDMVYRKP